MRLCFVLLVLSWIVGGSPAEQRERVLESVLPALVYGPTCWSGLELRNLGEQPAFLTRADHANVQPAECLRMLSQRLGETVAALDARANVANNVAHDLVGGLVRQSLQ